MVVIPDDPDPAGPFGWLFFAGRWGERQTWEFNGPTGPNVGEKWSDPIAAMDHWRGSSLTVPSSNAIGPNATDLFCTLSAAGSTLLIRWVAEPVRLAGAVLAIVAALLALIVVKSAELREAFALYRRHLRTFLSIGALTIPIGIAFNGLELVVRDHPSMEWVVHWLNDTAGARLTAVTVVGGVQQLAMVLLVAPPTIYVVKDIQTGIRPSVQRSFRLGYARFGALAISLATMIVLLGAFVIVLIGIPLAIWFAVRWQFFAQAVVFGERYSGPAALRQSGRAVTGRWWQALSDSLVFQLFALIPGPLVGATAMLLGKASVDFANSFSSIVFAVTVPISEIGLTLAYLRYRQRHETEARGAMNTPPPPSAALEPA